jgi:hypothetical protein
VEELRFKNGESRNPPDYLPLFLRERLKKTPAGEREKVKALVAPVVRTGKTSYEKKAAIQALQRAEAADAESLAPGFTDQDPTVQRLAVCEVIAVQRPSSAIPQITEYLRRHPDELLAGWFEAWFGSLDELPPVVMDFIRARMFTADGKPGQSTAFGRLPTTGPEAARTTELVVRYLKAAPADPQNRPLGYYPAMQLAGRLGPAAKAAVPFIRPALKNNRPSEVVTPAEAILRIVPGDPEAAGALLAILDSRSAEIDVSYQVIKLLAQFGPAELVVPKLMSMVEAGLKPRNGLEREVIQPWLCEVAAETLGELGPQAAAAVPLLRRCMAIPWDEQVPVGLVVRAAGAAGRIDPSERASVVRWLTDVLAGRRSAPKNNSADVRQYAAESLIALGPDARPAVPELVAYARRDGGRCRGLAAAIVRLDPDRFAEVLGLYSDGIMLEFRDWDGAEPSLRSLAVEGASHRDVAVRRAAWNLLAVIDFERSHEAQLRKLFAAESDPLTTRLATVAFARSSLQNLAAPRVDPPAEVAKTVRAWERANDRRLLPRKLALITEEPSRAGFIRFHNTMQQLTQTDPQTLRANLAALLAAFDKEQITWHWTEDSLLVQVLARAAPDAIGPLAARLGADRPPIVRVRAALALRMIGPKAAPAIPSLTKALDDPRRDVRLAAAEALLAIESPGSAAAIRTLADAELSPLTPEEPVNHSTKLSDLIQTLPNKRDRLAILRSLGPAAAPAVDVLRKCFNDRQSWRRVEAAEVLIRVDPEQSEDVVRILVGMLTAPRDRGRTSDEWQQAYTAIERLDSSARPAAKLLADSLAAHPDDELTAVFARALRRADPAAARAAGVR